jgi:hypothetical protein
VPRRYAVAALVLGALGLGWRIAMVAVGTPSLDSDEATIGLAALHIAHGRDFPIYFYGQHYMGTIQAYLAAPFVDALGPTVAALRIPLLLLYAAFLVLMYALVRRVFSTGLAVVTVGLLALGSDRVVRDHTFANGGYAESAPMVAGLLLLTYLLITRTATRWYAYLGWGVLFGLIVWDHWLPLPYLLGAAVVLVVSRVLNPRTTLLAIGGVVAGAAPLIRDNLTSARSDNSWTTFLNLTRPVGEASLVDRLDGGVFTGVPLSMGLCRPERCEGWSLWWSPVALGLLAAAIVLAVLGLWRGSDRARDGLRLVLAGAAVVSIASYVRTPQSALFRWDSVRYLSLLQLALPAMLWPLWTLARRSRAWAVPAVAVVSGFALAGLVATASLAGTRTYQAARVNQLAVIGALDARGITYVRGSYWTCDWIAYTTAERITCGVVEDDLRKGFNRYEPYWRPAADAHLGLIGSPLDAELHRRLPHAVPETVGRYHLYLGALTS